jgi:hypothetical protein
MHRVLQLLHVHLHASLYATLDRKVKLCLVIFTLSTAEHVTGKLGYPLLPTSP